jgi:hypothetical protein
MATTGNAASNSNVAKPPNTQPQILKCCEPRTDNQILKCCEPRTDNQVSVPDERLGKLAAMAKSKKVIGAQLEFVDIAGLVRGASEGAGLGNEFLSNIRQVLNP